MLIIAHRGARALAPENTLPAMQAAMDHGTKAIELDIHSHGDEFLVTHDRRLDRTTNGVGLLESTPLTEIQQLDAGNGTVMPTLWQVLELVDGRCALNIELKSVRRLAPLFTLLRRACHELNFTSDQFMLSSFDHHLLLQANTLDPEIRLGALTASRPLDECAFAEKLNAYSVNLAIETICPEMVNDAHRRGLKCFVYTVNHQEDWQWLAGMGADGVFCDVPEVAIKHYPQPQSARWD